MLFLFIPFLLILVSTKIYLLFFLSFFSIIFMVFYFLLHLLLLYLLWLFRFQNIFQIVKHEQYENKSFRIWILYSFYHLCSSLKGHRIMAVVLLCRLFCFSPSVWFCCHNLHQSENKMSFYNRCNSSMFFGRTFCNFLVYQLWIPEQHRDTSFLSKHVIQPFAVEIYSFVRLLACSLFGYRSTKLVVLVMPCKYAVWVLPEWGFIVVEVVDVDYLIRAMLLCQ